MDHWESPCGCRHPGQLRVGSRQCCNRFGFICLFFARYGEDEEEEEEEQQPIDHTTLLRGYNFASMLFPLIFVDNLLRWIEGRGDSNWFCSGKLEVLVLFGVLSLVGHFLYRSGIVAVVNAQRPGG